MQDLDLDVQLVISESENQTIVHYINLKNLMKRFDIINALISKYNYKSYLEIGVQNRKNCFDLVNCKKKVCVDPDPLAQADFQCTSNDFFDWHNDNFDIIFIDGLHHADQVYKDIVNALVCLNKGGTIVCHDMNPISYIMQVIPRVSKVWTGNCWEAWVKLRCTRKDLSMKVVDTDYGVGIIQRGSQELLNEECLQYGYERFDKNRHEVLNLISVNQFKLFLLND